MNDPEIIETRDDSEPELTRRTRRVKCYESKHTDRLVQSRADSPPRVKCTTCGDEFPCRHECEHWNCIVATNRALPEDREADRAAWASENAAFFARFEK